MREQDDGSDAAHDPNEGCRCAAVGQAADAPIAISARNTSAAMTFGPSSRRQVK